LIRLLIVDDHKVVRQGLRFLLQHELDIEIVGEAADGEQAVAAVRQHVPTVVLLDLLMPKMDGLAALRAIKEILLECKKAGLLDAPVRQTSGTLTVPKGVPVGLFARLVRMAGPPPWDDDLYDQCKAEYESDSDNIERLLEKEKARQNEKAK